MTLVIMAAGMGSRFGGLKQIEPIDENGNFIIDYSIYDAIRVGFTKIVFIIKEENYSLFRDTVGKRIENKVDVEYVFQKNDDLPKGFACPKDRIKPWGTAHAILACKDVVKENFAIINADDFYGKEAFIALSNFFKHKKDDDQDTYAMVGYKIKNTLTESGSVKRGVCEVKRGYLSRLIESNLITENNKVTAYPLDGSQNFIVNLNDTVSMNIFAFTPKIFNYLENRFITFLAENLQSLNVCEYLIPVCVEEQIKNNMAKVQVLKANAKWLGITYQEDLDRVKNEIKKLVDKKIYPMNLWK